MLWAQLYSYDEAQKLGYLPVQVFIDPVPSNIWKGVLFSVSERKKVNSVDIFRVSRFRNSALTRMRLI